METTRLGDERGSSRSPRRARSASSRPAGRRRPCSPARGTCAAPARAAFGSTRLHYSSRIADLAATSELRVVPANAASCEDLRAVFGTRGEAYRCQCQRYKLAPGEAFKHFPVEERAHRLRTQTECGHPESVTTSGLVAYSGGEPVGWCAVEPRTHYPGLLRVYRVPWEGRSEVKADDSVWAVTCILVRAGYRRRGISHALARAAVEFARERGARVLEGYPMLTQPGKEITWGELHVGSRSIFEAAGFRQVSHPTPRRVVMRIDF